MRNIGLYVFVSAYCAGVTAFVLPASRLYVGVIAAVVVAAAYVLRQKNVLTLICVAIVCVIVAVGRLSVSDGDLPDVIAHNLDTKVRVTGTVVALPDVRETSVKLTIEGGEGRDQSRILATAPLYPEVHVGDKVVLTGKLSLPVPFETDGGRTFAYDTFLEKDGIRALLPLAQVEVVGRSTSIWLRFLRGLEWLRGTLITLFSTALPEPESSLAVGLIVGGKQGLGEELIHAFTAAGMLQLVVLSGYNVMIVAAVIMKMLSVLPKRIAYVCALISMASFVLMAGAGSAALRAGLMAIVAITARTFGKEYDVLGAVSLSLLAIGIVNPLLLVYDPGFQFSFIATLGLVLFSPITARWVEFLRSPVLIELVSTTLAAELTLLPFLLWQTGHLSLVSLIANVLATPAVPIAMGTSVLAALLALPLSYLSPVLPVIAGVPAYLPLTYIIQIATISSSLPYADLIVPAFPFSTVVVVYGLLLVVLVRSRRPRRGSDAPRRPS